MRVLCKCLAVVAAAMVVPACASEDPWVVRPANGGPGGTADAPDADPGPDAGPDDELLGRVCVLDDFQELHACPTSVLADGVSISTTATPVTTVVSDADGVFSFTTSDASLLVDVGTEADALHPTRTTLVNTAGATPVDAPAFTQALWDDMLATLLQTEVGAGAALVYVEDSTGAPVADAVVTQQDAPVDQRDYFDDGVGGWDANATDTGPDGIALLLDCGVGAITVTAPGYADASGALTTRAGTVGVTIVTLTAL